MEREWRGQARLDELNEGTPGRWNILFTLSDPEQQSNLTCMCGRTGLKVLHLAANEETDIPAGFGRKCIKRVLSTFSYRKGEKRKYTIPPPKGEYTKDTWLELQETFRKMYADFKERERKAREERELELKKRAVEREKQEAEEREKFERERKAREERELELKKRALEREKQEAEERMAAERERKAREEREKKLALEREEREKKRAASLAEERKAEELERKARALEEAEERKAAEPERKARAAWWHRFWTGPPFSDWNGRRSEHGIPPRG